MLATTRLAAGVRRADLIVCGHLHLLPFAAALQLRHRCPVLPITYGFESWSPTPHPTVNRLCRRLKSFVAIRRVSAERLIEWSGARNSRYYHLPNCVDETAYGVAQKRPDLVTSLILCDTAHKIATREFWDARIDAVKAGGVESVADAVMPRWFAPDFLATPECEGYRTMLARQPVDGYVASCIAIRDADLTETARSIGVPAVVVGGEHDGATPPALCAEFARLIPGARFELVKNAGHIVPVEQPQMLSEIIRACAALNRQGALADAATRH